MLTEDFKNRCIYEYLTRGKMPLEFQSLSHKYKSIIWSGVVKEAQELQKELIKKQIETKKELDNMTWFQNNGWWIAMLILIGIILIIK